MGGMSEPGPMEQQCKPPWHTTACYTGALRLCGDNAVGPMGRWVREQEIAGDELIAKADEQDAALAAKDADLEHLRDVAVQDGIVLTRQQARIAELEAALTAYVEPLPMHAGMCQMKGGGCILEESQKWDRLQRARAALAPKEQE